MSDRLEAGQHQQGGRLPRTGGAEHGQELALPDLHVEVLYDQRLAVEGFVDIVEFDESAVLVRHFALHSTHSRAPRSVSSRHQGRPLPGDPGTILCQAPFLANRPRFPPASWLACVTGMNPQPASWEAFGVLRFHLGTVEIEPASLPWFNFFPSVHEHLESLEVSDSWGVKIDPKPEDSSTYVCLLTHFHNESQHIFPCAPKTGIIAPPRLREDGIRQRLTT